MEVLIITRTATARKTRIGRKHFILRVQLAMLLIDTPLYYRKNRRHQTPFEILWIS